MRITKPVISMRTWRSQMSAASYVAFVVIPEISYRYFLHNKSSENRSLLSRDVIKSRSKKER